MACCHYYEPTEAGDAGLVPLVEAVAERIEDIAAHLENA